jgi:hypothetical protein
MRTWCKLAILYNHALAVVRGPDTSDTGVRAEDGLVGASQLLPARVS